MGRAIRRGVEKWYACPLIANMATPSRAEITAGTEITESIASISGFALTNSPVTTPDLGSRFDKTVAGIDSAGDSSLTMWDEVASGTGSDPARAAMPKDADKVIVRMPYGDTPGLRCEVWRVTVLGNNDQNDMAAAMQYQVGFSIRDVPTQNAVVPALS